MIDKGILIDNAEYLNRAKEISNDFLIARNFYIKTQVADQKCKENIIKKIYKIINSAKEKERKLFQDLIKELEGNA